MSRLPQLLRKPAVVTAMVAVLLLVVAFTFLLLRPHNTISTNGSLSATPEPVPASATSTVMSASPAIRTSSPSAATGSVTGNPVPPSTARASGSKAIGWLMEYTPGGLGGPGIPPGYYAYAEFSTASCDAIARSTVNLTGSLHTLYEGATAGCMAAFGGHLEKWAQAESALSQLTVNTTAFSCLDRDVYLMLGTLISMHHQFPTYRFVRGSPSVTRTTCPRITGVIPDHGPIEGGKQVQVRGVNLPASLVVDFSEVSASPVQSNGTEATLITPPFNSADSGDCPCTAYLSVDGFWYGQGSGVAYTYQPQAAEATASSGSP